MNTTFTNIKPSWIEIFKKYTKELQEIKEKLDNDNIEGLERYPNDNLIFRAFNFFDIDQLKVVIIGQDCYHQPGQAQGLCFAVPNNFKKPPSLINIYKEIKDDIGELNCNNDLTEWANQGVLLLNSALTVRQSCAGSHLKIWKEFTDNIIRDISNSTTGIVFLLWGKYAQSKIKLINDNKDHHILTANHPSPLSANRGGWFKTKHFSKTNEILGNEKAIKW